MWKASQLTDPIFFDTDCISSFFWVKKEKILNELYQGRIVIPEPVYDELNNPTVHHLAERMQGMLERKEALTMPITVSTTVYDFYLKLIKPQAGNVASLGRGEAACVALAKFNNGIVASNNLKDVCFYVRKFDLRLLTVGDILVEAFDRKVISEEEGNQIWQEMISKRRKLGADSFSEYLQRGTNTC